MGRVARLVRSSLLRLIQLVLLIFTVQGIYKPHKRKEISEEERPESPTSIIRARPVLLLEPHAIPAPLLLVKLEIVGTQPESTEKAVSEFFEFAEHFVLFFLLLHSDSCGKCVECALRLIVDGR
jgi:hypothetical protein